VQAEDTQTLLPFLDINGDIEPPKPIAARARRTSIDDKINKAVELCPKSNVSWASRTEDGLSYLICQPCNKYRCPVCGPRKRYRLVKRIQEANPNKFITLTLPHDDTPQAKHAIAKKALPKFARLIRKQFGEFEYCRMSEHHADGYPHFHLLARCQSYIPWQTLLQHWHELTGSQRIDIRKAHGKSAGYIAKYMNKARGEDYEFSRQRMSVSQNFWSTETKREPTYEWIEYKRIRDELKWIVRDLAKNNTINRLRVKVYYTTEREPGDELPEELQPFLIDERTITETDKTEYEDPNKYLF